MVFFHSLPVPELREWVFAIPFPFLNFGNGIIHSRSRSRTPKFHSRSPLAVISTRWSVGTQAWDLPCNEAKTWPWGERQVGRWDSRWQLCRRNKAINHRIRRTQRTTTDPLSPCLNLPGTSHPLISLQHLFGFSPAGSPPLKRGSSVNADQW